jgi:hypothetical protein
MYISWSVKCTPQTKMFQLSVLVLNGTYIVSHALISNSHLFMTNLVISIQVLCKVWITVDQTGNKM